MAHEIPDLVVTLEASTDLSARQFHAVVVNSAGMAALPGAAGLPIYGVLQNKPIEGEAGTVMNSGITKMFAAGSTLAVGDLVAASSIGRAIVPGAGAYAIGRVVFGSSGSTGRILSVALMPIGTT